MKNPIVRKYYFFMFTISHGFIMPILTQYVIYKGISLSQVGTLEALFMIAWVLGEIPSGYLGDRIGHRITLTFGSILKLFAIVGFVIFGSFLAFAFLYCFWAFGNTFRSGVADAWLYDSLDEKFEEGLFSRIKGRGNSILLLVTAVTSVIGSQLAALNWLYPFIANSVLLVINVLICITLPKIANTNEKIRTVNLFETFTVIKTKFMKKSLRSFVIYTSLFYGFASVAATFTQPVSTNLGISVANLGWLYAAFNIVASVLSYYTGKIESKIGMKNWFLFILVGCVAIFTGSFFSPILILPMFVVIRSADRVSEALRIQYINDRIPSIGRATVLSAAAMISAIMAAVFRITGGIIAEETNPINMLLLLSGITFLALVCIQSFSPPFQETSDRRMTAGINDNDRSETD